ncbi:hypothetical protein [Streptomyces sp. NPDC101249]|uniref:hypothetical protein n=1 Tax=Streptomyces sp. NPDC101249 TaxID=3366140 RepID=UPI0037FDB25A
MIHPLPRRTAAASALALAAVLAAGGCARPGGDDARAPGTAAPPASPRPAASGTGPYPTPSGASAASPPDAASASATGPTGTPKDGTPRASGVRRTDPDAVGAGALRVLWTFDTAVDDGPSAADLRAADAGWLTAGYARQLRSAPGAVGGAQWREWSGHRAYTTVALTAADDAARPPDTATEAWRQWIVTATPHGRDAWRGEATTTAAYVRLTRSGPARGWQVAGVGLR